jgi:hypothetical protein
MRKYLNLMLIIGVVFCITQVSNASTQPFPLTQKTASYDLNFTLVNKTGYTIAHIFVAPTTEREWGDDIMGKDMLANGEEVDIIFSTDEVAAKWDIYVTWDGYESDEDVFWIGFDLSKISIITLYYDAKTNKTWAEYE